jgi:hypothetical protein
MLNDMTTSQYCKYITNFEGLFWHWSNVIFAYKECGLQTPSWFLVKYNK